ncbi:MAG: YbjQ family protein [Phycisphaerales bacterium]|nr:YbjQ family protein [Phycisphaerales bacterium]
MTLTEVLLTIAPFLSFVILGFLVGSFVERRHLRQLAAREAAASDILVTNLKRVPNPENIRQAGLVGGQVVIATDYFKSIATALRNLIGGEMQAVQSMLIRARREAILRMIDEARQMGAKEVWNVRFSFCNISQMSGNKGAMSVEIYAYGTAVLRES